ncbi:TetR/AcrR family transcriptional regulator [uncultured Ruminococcus sp.]|uniref:TetR/AcrR family transcriptional regulator n=1 Tax=uncultured Ruminococcus sp. TaxID=165186 RepID=UPI00260130CA|nr:TetR/AcrR family transcriptional regulator [uncultured Ruminococcus sp.]
MPQIFDKVGRDRVRIQLLETGFELIKQHGMKKTSVSEIAKKTGIATGTFYNYFPSKEEFIYQLVVYKRQSVKAAFEELTANGKADREQFRRYLRRIYLEDNDVFQYLSDEEINILRSRWKEEYWKNERNDEQTSKWVLSCLSGLKPNVDWKVFANFTKSISLIRHGKEKLYEEEYEATIEMFIDAIIDHLFE